MVALDDITAVAVLAMVEVEVVVAAMTRHGVSRICMAKVVAVPTRSTCRGRLRTKQLPIGSGISA